MSLFKKKSNVDADVTPVTESDVDKEKGFDSEPDVADGKTSGIEIPVPVPIPEITDLQDLAEDEGDTETIEEGEVTESDDPVLILAASIASQIQSGTLSDDARSMLNKALNYETDMLRLESEAELRGRNAAIREHLDNMDHGDGVPHPGGGQGAVRQSACCSIFDLARGAK